MASRLTGWRVAAVVAGLSTIGTIGALVVTLQSLSETDFDGMNNMTQIPFALPRFLIPIGTQDHLRDAWVVAGFGLLNAALIFWWIARRRPVRSS